MAAVFGFSFYVDFSIRSRAKFASARTPLPAFVRELGLQTKLAGKQAQQCEALCSLRCEVY